MDNISKRSFLQKCAKFFSFILYAVPGTADAIGILSFVFPDIQNLLSSLIGANSIIVLAIINNVVLVGNIIFSIERQSRKKQDKSLTFINGYDNLLRNYADYLLAFEEKCDSITKIDDLYWESSHCLKTIIDNVRDIISDITGEKIRVCVKSFPEKYGHNDITKMELVTFCRSDKSLRDSIIERNDRISVNDNTDFKHIMSGTYTYFAFNGLESFEKETKTPYQNSTPGWEKRYKATIVYPISKKIGMSHGRAKYEILGFLCIDTLSTKAFSADNSETCIKFISSISSLMYIFLDKCITYREKIERKQLDEEKEVA